MHPLELRIPPPAVAALVAVAMWRISLATPGLEVPGVPRAAMAAVLALIGFSIDVAGLISFRRAKTTINPMKPGTTSALVTSGIYRMSRNPMYVGLLFVLVAWAVYLPSAWALLGPPAFILYINRFQIAPEERILEARFGGAYSDYKRTVRRWL
jgi:protein-S-isoprenylcysteine O-methyltransferase Ste14